MFISFETDIATNFSIIFIYSDESIRYEEKFASQKFLKIQISNQERKIKEVKILIFKNAFNEQKRRLSRLTEEKTSLGNLQNNEMLKDSELESKVYKVNAQEVIGILNQDAGKDSSVDGDDAGISINGKLTVRYNRSVDFFIDKNKEVKTKISQIDHGSLFLISTVIVMGILFFVFVSCFCYKKYKTRRKRRPIGLKAIDKGCIYFCCKCFKKKQKQRANLTQKINLNRRIDQPRKNSNHYHSFTDASNNNSFITKTYFSFRNLLLQY